MFAVINAYGRNYKVVENGTISIEELQGQPGSKIEFLDVLMIGGVKSSIVGTPKVKGALVTAEVLSHSRGPKVIIFKKKRRKNYRRKHTCRQDITHLKILTINYDRG